MSEPRFPTSPDDFPTAEELAGCSGLDWIRGAMEGRFPVAPIARLANLQLLEAVEGRVTFEGRPALEHYNPMGSVHGGWFGVLLDSAMGCAVLSRLPSGVGYTTLEYKVNLLRPATVSTGPLRAVGESLHVGRRTATAEGRILDERGRVFATGTTTCLLFPMSAPTT